MQRITQLWKSGIRGKLLIGCGGLLVLLFACTIIIAIPSQGTKPQATITPTAVIAKTATAAKPTDTPKPTGTPIPTATVAQPTKTPTPVPPTATVAQPTKTSIPVQPTSTPRPPTATVSPGNVGVKITRIFYNGEKGQNEPDEFAEITNMGAVPVNLKGWRLNAGVPGQDFIFPEFNLQPGHSCLVYTNEIHPESCGFSFGSKNALWNNDKDCGYLYDTTGALVDTRCY